MKRNIIKQMLMVMALSTSMAYGAGTQAAADRAFADSLRKPDAKKSSGSRAGKKNQRGSFSRTSSAASSDLARSASDSSNAFNRSDSNVSLDSGSSSSVSSLANRFETGAANNAVGTPVADAGIVPASPRVADTVAQMNSLNAVSTSPASVGMQGPTANINDLAPVHSDAPVTTTTAPNLDELLGTAPAPVHSDATVSSVLPAPVVASAPAAPNLDDLLGTSSTASVAPAPQQTLTPQEVDNLLGGKPLAATVVAPVEAPNASAPVPVAPVAATTGPSPVVSSTPTASDLDALLGTATAPAVVSKAPVSSSVAPAEPSLDELLGTAPALHQDTAATVSAPLVTAPVVASATAAPNLDELLGTAPAPAHSDAPVTAAPDLVASVPSSVDTVAQLQQHADTVTTAVGTQLDQHQANVAADTAAQLQQHADTLTTAVSTQLDQHQATVAADTAAQLQQHADKVTAAVGTQLDQHQANVAADTAAQLQQHADTLTTAVGTQLDQHQANLEAGTAAQLQQHADAISNLITDSATVPVVAPVPTAETPSLAPVSQQPVADVITPAPLLATSNTIGSEVQQPSSLVSDPLVVPTDTQAVVTASVVDANLPAPVTGVPVGSQPVVSAADATVASPTELDPTSAPVVASPVVDGYVQAPDAVLAPTSAADAAVTAPDSVTAPEVAKPRLPDDVIAQIEAAAKRAVELQSRFSNISGQAIVDAKLAKVKADNDMQDAEQQQKVTDSISGINTRLTALLNASEEECRAALEAIDSELGDLAQQMENKSGLNHEHGHETLITAG